jgi:rhamnogalacturonan acetylesterase
MLSLGSTTLIFLSLTFASYARSVDKMKISNLTAVAACPPICVSAYPKLLIAGDSTTANYEGGPLQGWGYFINQYVNLSVFNLAKNGRSTRSFRNEGLWRNLLSLASPGDFVIIEMGHNDNGPVPKIVNKNDTTASRRVLPGTGDETVVQTTGPNQTEIVHTFGWYLKNMIVDVREKKCIPIISSMTPRYNWDNATNTLNADYKYRDYAKTVAEELKAEFVDHNRYSLRELQNLGPVDAKKFFPRDNTHTNAKGARSKWLLRYSSLKTGID